MILPGLPTSGTATWTVFTPTLPLAGTGAFMPWLKPIGASWIYVISVSGGAGGGGATGGAAGTNRNGAGGGGSSAMYRALYPAFCLPDMLHILVGAGGAGGAPGSPGVDGVPSYVSIAPSNNQSVLIVNGAGGAPGASVTTAGGGGSGFQNSPIGNYWGFVTAFGGQGGGAGATYGGGGLNYGTSVPLTGGTGGAGLDTAQNQSPGGSISSGATLPGPNHLPTVAGGVLNGGTGLPGFNHNVPLLPLITRQSLLIFSGGTGGGSSGAGVGGSGGPGAWGCGGGGGAVGTASSGAGGRGGDGFVIIGAF